MTNDERKAEKEKAMAGNGMVGQELRAIGAEHIVGIDIIPEAATATARDRFVIAPT